MTVDIKQRAKDIMKSDMVNMLIGAAIFAVVSIVSASISGGIIGNAIAGLINSVAGACSACFYFRAYNRGKADINDTYSLLKDSANLPKIMTIMLAMWIINTLISLAGNILVFIPLVGIIAWMVLAIGASFLLMIVWYLFVANPDYPTEYYLKGSSKYMGPEFFSYIGFVISVAIGPILIEALVSMILGGTLAGILCIPFDVYINLAIAGFIASIIPDRWFNGTEIL